VPRGLNVVAGCWAISGLPQLLLRAIRCLTEVVIKRNANDFDTLHYKTNTVYILVDRELVETRVGNYTSSVHKSVAQSLNTVQNTTVNGSSSSHPGVQSECKILVFLDHFLKTYIWETVDCADPLTCACKWAHPPPESNLIYY
jgi:hypothetical protein